MGNAKLKHDKIGIYLITCIISKKVYVGESFYVYGRWWKHKSDLKNNKHKNQHLQAAWNLYGKESFVWSLLETIENKDKSLLRAKEKYWISYFKAENPEFGYNIINAEEKAIIRNKSRIIKKRLHKKIYQLCPINNIPIKIWDSYKEVCEHLNISLKKLSKIFWRSVGKDRKFSFRNFIWVKEKDYIEGYDYRQEAHKLPSKPKKPKPPKVYKAVEEYNIKRNPISFQNIETQEIRNFRSQSEAAKELGFSSGVINNLIRGWKSKGRGKKAFITQWRGWKIYK